MSRLMQDGYESDLTMFPYIKPSENTEVLPCYTSVLRRCTDEGVGMKDLDQLQQELEKLLCSCALRNRLLLSEFEVMDTVEERHERKRKLLEPPSPKFRKLKEKVKQVKDSKVPYKLIKNFHEELPKLEVPKTTMPRNDTKSKFWMSVDPYCAPITRDDALFLEGLMQECNASVDLNIPEAGSHYSLEWTTCFHSDQPSTALARAVKGNKMLKNGFIEKYSSSMMVPITSALLEENVTNMGSQDKLSKDMSIRPINKTGMCMDIRLRKELEELGILDMEDDHPKGMQDEDDVIKEIKRCHSELLSLNDHNKRELNRLHGLVIKDRARQELNDKLEDVDTQIMDIYNKLLIANNKQKAELEWEAVRVIQLQRHLHKEAMDMTNLLF